MDIREFPRDAWPEALRQIPQPPERLWLRGAMPEEGAKLLAVVGSRALSHYGRDACEYLIQGLAGYPISIVSGLALGADACAHRAALAAGLHTIAIPGSGLDDSVIGPRANLALAKDIIAKGGALMSEHEPLHTARPFDFPARNRIMVGMADAVLVIEAGPRSGTLISARLAGDYGRELLAVPHRIRDEHGFGPHLFLRLGATLAAEPSHILEALGFEAALPQAQGTPALEGAEQALWELLGKPQARDELLRESALPAGETLTALIALELKGLIKEEFGAWRRL